MLKPSLKFYLLITLLSTLFVFFVALAFDNPTSSPPTGGGYLQTQSGQLLITKPTKVTSGNNFIVENGNVGIGTTAPGARLYVKTTDLNTIPFQVEALAQVSSMPGWSYRRPITISNTGSALTDYQVYVTLDTASLISAGKMRTDCGDIRFTDSDGLTPLSYWIESGCNSASTKIWVKVPSIPSGTKIIYVYYGNPSASSASNAKNTMFIYEDMETAPSGALASSAVYDATNKWVRLTTAAGGLLGYLYYDKNPGAQGFYSKFRFWTGGGSGADAVWLGVYDTSYSNTEEDVVNGGYHFTYDEYQDRICFTKSTTGIACASETTIDNSAWHTAEIYYWKSGSTVYTKIYYDGVLKVDSSDDSPQSNALNGVGQTIWGARTGGFTNEHRIDDLIVRKYASPEPTTSVGAEETSSLQQQTVFYIQNNTGNVGIGTTAPAQKLHVEGNTYISGNVGIGTTNPGSRLEVLGSTSDNTASALNVTNSGGTSLLYVRNDGNVGIGTTAPQVKLDVVGIIKGQYGGGITAGGAGVTKYFKVGSLPYTSLNTFEKLYVQVWGGGNSAWEWQLSGIDEYVISSRGGKVIYRQRKLGETGNYQLLVYNTGSGYDFFIAVVNQNYPNILIRSFRLQSEGAWVEQQIVETTPSGTNDTSNWTVYTTITTDKYGNVGIGTTNPGAKLQVDDAGYQALRVGANIEGLQGGGIIVGNASGGRHLIINDVATARWAFATGYYDLDIQNDYGGTWTSRMYITETGNVGIGTTNPQRQLDIGGTGHIAFLGNSVTTNSTAGLYWYTDDRYGIYRQAGAWTPPYPKLQIKWATGVDIDTDGAGYNLILAKSGGNVGIGTTTPGYKLDVVGDIRTTGCLVYNGGTLGTCVSEEQLKNVIGSFQIDNALSKIIQLKPVKYTFKFDPAQQVLIGLLAEETEKIAPELIEIKDGQKQIKYGELQWMQIEAIKELNNKIKELQKEIDELKAQLTSLK